MRLPVCQINEPHELNAQPWFQDLKASASASGEAAGAVAAIIDDVRRHGDEAVVRYMQKWTDPSFSAGRIRVTPDELAAALRAIDPELRRALETAIDHVRRYQDHIRPLDLDPVTIDGAELGLRFTPVDSVGLAVPGGKAAYPSSVVMLAVPAQAAGVPADRISVVTPPPTRLANAPAADVSPLVLAACALVGVERVYRIGGAQAIAALAFGTATVQPVDMIVGPGNIYTQLAKQQVAGRVGIDGFYGPSEIVTVADASANPARVASDLIAQAEHDPGRCILVTWRRDVIDRVNDELEKQLAQRTRRSAIEDSLAKWSAAVLVPDEAAAAAVANAIAAEHVNLAVADPQAWLPRVRHGGEIFLGDLTPVAAGDYFAGPSHCLPTATTARFTSGVSAYTFLKRTGTVHYPNGMLPATIEAIARLAEAEGLDGHAASVRARDRG
jgi:histidinol dehydrogenase